MSREKDSWLSKAQHAALRRADEADQLRSHSTQVVSNGEYFPMPQTLEQKQVEAHHRARGRDREAPRHEPAPLPRLFGGHGERVRRDERGLRPLFDVNPLEMLEPRMRKRYAGGPLRRPAPHDPRDDGRAARPAGCRRAKARPRRPRASTRTRSTPKACPTSSGARGARGTRRSGKARSRAPTSRLVKFVKDVYLDSQVSVAILSNAPLGLFEPPGGGKPRIPRQRRRVAHRDEPHRLPDRGGARLGERIAGSTRLLAHGQIFPGRENLGFMQQQIDSSTDSWKGYNIAYTAKLDNDPESELKAVAPRRREGGLSDLRADPQQPQGAEGASGLLQHLHPQGLARRARHAGAGRAGRPAQGGARLARAQLHHLPRLLRAFFDAEALESIRTEKLRNGVPTCAGSPSSPRSRRRSGTSTPRSAPPSPRA